MTYAIAFAVSRDMHIFMGSLQQKEFRKLWKMMNNQVIFVFLYAFSRYVFLLLSTIKNRDQKNKVFFACVSVIDQKAIITRLLLCPWDCILYCMPTRAFRSASSHFTRKLDIIYQLVMTFKILKKTRIFRTFLGKLEQTLCEIFWAILISIPSSFQLDVQVGKNLPFFKMRQCFACMPHKYFHENRVC